MSKLRIGFTGTHGVGKTYIVEELSKLLSGDFSVEKVGSITRRVKDTFGLENNESGDWELQVLCTALRAEAQALSESSESQIIISERTALDELVYTTVLLSSSPSESKRTMLASVQLLEEEFVRRDVEDFWDVIFVKRPHPDYVPEEDGFRSVSEAYQKLIQDQFDVQIETYSALNPIFVDLPLDRDEAVEFAFTWIQEKLSD